MYVVRVWFRKGKQRKKEDDSLGIGPQSTWVPYPHGCTDSDCLSCQHMVFTVTSKSTQDFAI